MNSAAAADASPGRKHLASQDVRVVYQLAVVPLVLECVAGLYKQGVPDIERPGEIASTEKPIPDSGS